MNESVAIAKDTKKGFSPSSSDKSVHRLRDEPERQLGSLRDVIGNIRRDGGTLSVDSIATELSSMTSTECAPVLLALQQTHGNRYVQRVVAGIQAKLVVGQPGDIYELEADRIADEVMEMSESEVQRQSGEEEEGFINPDTKKDKKSKCRATPESVTEKKLPRHNFGKIGMPRIPKGSGKPIRPEQRVLFERSIKHPLDHVRIHTGPQVNKAAMRMGAEAFTVGSDIYFADGAYAPGTSKGDRALAHELVHVRQGDEGRIPIVSSREDAVSSPTDLLEHEAYGQEEAIAQQVSLLRGDGGEHISVQHKSPPPSEKDVATEASGMVAAEGQEDDKLVPKLPEHPSHMAETLAESPAPPEVETHAPTPASVKAAAAMVQRPAPEETIAARVSTVQKPKLPAGDTLHEIESDLEPVTLEYKAQPQEALPDVIPSVGEFIGISSDERGYAVAATRADVLMQESQMLSENVASVGGNVLDGLMAEGAHIIEAVQARAEEARAGVATTYTAQQEAVLAEVEVTKAAVEGARQQKQQAILTFAQTETARLDGKYQAEKENVSTFIEGLKDETVAAGEDEAQRALTESENRAQAILSEGNAINVSGDEALVEAQQKAARRIGEHTAEKCRETGADLAERVRTEASNHAKSYDGQLGEYRNQLKQILVESKTALNEFSNLASRRIDIMARDATFSAETMGEQSYEGFESEKNAAQAQIQIWANQATATIEAFTNQMLQTITTQLVAYQETFTNYGVSAAEQLSAADQPDPNDVEEVATSVRQSMQESHNEAIMALKSWNSNALTELIGLFEQMVHDLSSLVSERNTAAEETGAELVQSLQEAGQNAAQGMENAATSFQEEFTAVVDTSIEEIRSAGEKFRSEMQGPHKEALSAFTRLVDEGLASEDKLLTDARQKMSSAQGQITGKYHSLKAEADRRSASEGQVAQTRIHRGLWSDLWNIFPEWVDSVRTWFANTFGEFWGGLLFGILAGLVIVLIGSLILTGLGALLAFIGVSAKVVAIVVVAVALVVAIPLLIYNRFQEFYDDNPGESVGLWQAVGLGVLGILDITGIPFIIEAVLGKRVTGGTLEGFERWERLGFGLVFFVAIAAIGVRALLRGKPRMSARSRARPKGRPEARPEPEARPAEVHAQPTGKTVLGGEGGDIVTLHRYTNRVPNTVEPHCHWTEWETLSIDSASRMTGVPKELINVRLTVKVQRSALDTYFRDAGSKFVPGEGGALEFQNNMPIPSESFGNTPLEVHP